MQLGRDWLLGHIPHQGGMCLLDGIVSWDAQRIRCTASSHRAADNPLRAHGRLGAACGIEYAAQAMAAHGGLLAAGNCCAPGSEKPCEPPPVGAKSLLGLPGERLESTTPSAPRAGFLASVRGVDLQVARLDDIAADLQIDAERLSGDDNTILYGFSVSDGARVLLHGRAIVVLDAAKLGSPG